MDLQCHIRLPLWQAVESTYVVKNYSQAILAAVHHLSTVLRERSGADGDGVKLVAQALGGDSPPIRLNKLQTETERNQQIGTLNMLNGIYQAIRNPRSHGQVVDDKETADAVIYFINYLLAQIEESVAPFTIERFLTSVFDKDFVADADYAALIAAEVPNNILVDTLVAVYRAKLNGDMLSVGLTMRALLARMVGDQIGKFLNIAGNELRTATDERVIQYNFHALPPELWQQLPEIPRMRIENIVLNSLRQGQMVDDANATGTLAISAKGHFPYFSAPEGIRREFVRKLSGNSESEMRYVVCNFFLTIPKFVASGSEDSCNSRSMEGFVVAIEFFVREGDQRVYAELIQNFDALPPAWQDALADALIDMTDEVNPLIVTVTGRPLLTEPEPPNPLSKYIFRGPFEFNPEDL